MPGYRLATVAYLLVLLLASPFANAQPPQGDEVAGKVVSEIDGRPLAHAVVTLTDIKVRQITATTFSDIDGHFRFDAVAPGKYRLTGNATHYLSAAYLAHGQYGTAIVTGAGLATNALELRLVPVAMIAGRVLDENGDPVQRAMVTLYRENLEGYERIMRFRNVQTNEDGEYELTGLPRGRYFLSASATPWYAVHPPTDQEGARPSYRLAVDPALDVAYPTVFYPDALEPEGASPLVVRGGEQLSVMLRMHPQRAVTLTLRLASGAGPNPSIMPRLTRSVFGLEEQVLAQTEFREGVQRITGIAPGQYTVGVEAGGNGFPVHSQPIRLTTASTSVDLPEASDLATVTVTVHSSDGAALPTPLQLSLRSAQLNRLAGSRVNDKGVAELANIPRGEYSFVLNGARSMNVVRLSVNGQVIADKRLHIAGSGSVAVDVTVSGVAVQMEGLARRGGKPAEGSMVVLVPAGADTSEYLFRRDQSDLDGSFTFSGVVPGNYILVAIDDGWPLHWTDMPTLAPYLMHGLPVSVPATGPATIHLVEAVAAQARTRDAEN